ncbi:MAG: UvrD-helicase domain-containing protein [Blastochloris sp.]|nr:UvrD-helicase domain-containing protein [Blastochloris sp.]
MSRLLHGLNAAQREAVMTTQGPLLVLAGAGTGKTRVITHRMAYLIEQGARPPEILSLTFTNKAAREMKERFRHLVEPLVDKGSLKAMFAGTFHSFCVRLLREHIGHLGYKENFTIYDDGDQQSLLKQVINRAGGNSAEAGKFKFLISLAKNKGLPLPDASSEALAPTVYRHYQEELKLKNAVDFDDLLVLAVRLLREFPEVRESVRQRIRYVLVDEYQDTNALQFEIVRRVTSETHDVCVVGDDDQSIYSWRGAESANILEFDQHFPGAKIVKLEQNYRCTPNILEAANRVIKNNARRHGKTLWAEGAAGQPIRLVTAGNDTEESAWVVSDILRLRRDENLRWENFAVLYRANHLSRVFEQELRKMKVPYQVVGGMEFFERREVKDMVAYLQVILNPNDDISLLRVINLPPRGVGKTTVENLIEISRRDKQPIWQIMQSETGGRGQAGIDRFIKLLNAYHIRVRQETCWSQIFKDLIAELGFFEELKRTSKDVDEARSRIENVEELVSALVAFEEKKEGNLTDFVDTLRLDTSQKDEKEDQGFGVTLMTLHAAKGLEFPHVYIVGVEEGTLPHDRSKAEGSVDEERRLFYVGITRAMKGLALSYCASRKRYGQEMPCHPRVFFWNCRKRSWSRSMPPTVWSRSLRMKQRIA